MRPRRTPNSDRGTSAPRGGGHGHDHDRDGGHDRGRDHSHEHDARGRYHAHDRDDRVPRQTQLSGSMRQQLSRKPEQTCEASEVPPFRPRQMLDCGESGLPLMILTLCLVPTWGGCCQERRHFFHF